MQKRILKSALLLYMLTSFVLYEAECTIRNDKMEEASVFLYKILTEENWQKSKLLNEIHLDDRDASFIHFSKEDQLERILEKYWKNEMTFVILKIEARKLIGELIYEANPGGVIKYYHLYNGSIPLEAVVESRLIKREYGHTEGTQRSCLRILETGEAVLRQQSRPLSPDEILNPEIQIIIQQMVDTMRAQPGVGLAAPQAGIPLQIVVVEDKVEYHSYLTKEQLIERGRVPIPLHVIINPILYIEEEEEACFFEGCLSVPMIVGIVPRAKKVRVECLNEKAQAMTINATGWFARILQHEIDHLNGILYLDLVETGTLITQDNFYNIWRTKAVKEAQSALSVPKRGLR